MSFRKRNKIRPVVASLLETTGIDLTNGGGIPELIRFQEHFHEYKIVVYDSLHCDNIIYEGHVESPKRINLFYDDVTRHYHVITNLTGAMVKRYVCRACNKGCSNGVRHMCDQTCSDCMTSPPCAYVGVRIPCVDCNRYFRSQSCYDSHKKTTVRSWQDGQDLCEQKKCCGMCGAFITEKKHDCNKGWCDNWGVNRDRTPMFHETSAEHVTSQWYGPFCILRFWDNPRYQVFRFSHCTRAEFSLSTKILF